MSILPLHLFFFLHVRRAVSPLSLLKKEEWKRERMKLFSIHQALIQKAFFSKLLTVSDHEHKTPNRDRSVVDVFMMKTFVPHEGTYHLWIKHIRQQKEKTAGDTSEKIGLPALECVCIQQHAQVRDKKGGGWCNRCICLSISIRL